MSAPSETIVTAGLRPDLLGHLHPRSFKRSSLALLLGALVLFGLAFRAAGLGAEGFSEDELNKLHAVEDYRENGLTSANGEHPMLMKAILTLSLAAADFWNSLPPATAHPEALRVSPEAALRFPSALFGALTAVLIYLIAAELFGAEVALVAAALWAFDPTAIGMNRIAKEDSFFVFFFLLANFFWLRSQRLTEGGSDRSPAPYYWATGAAFGAMLASKYMLQFIAVSVSYNFVFQGLPHRRWRIGRPRYLQIFVCMGVVFLLCNPAILLPDTWRKMSAFASYKLMAHDSYEFMGRLYSHKLTDWFRGTPWYFFPLFTLVKHPALTVAAFVAGLPQLFRRKAGDGRYFILFWLFIWALTFIPTGGKFARYYTTVLPCVFVAAAVGIEYASGFVARQLAPAFRGAGGSSGLAYPRLVLIALVLLSSGVASAKVAPHYRLYLNLFGGGAARAGDYFPHDEFYDASVRDAVSEIARRARPGARIASETARLTDYYADRVGRLDIESVSLSDPAEVKGLQPGDFIIAARGRRYYSNEALLSALEHSAAPAFSVSLGETRAIDVYALDDSTIELVRGQAR